MLIQAEIQNEHSVVYSEQTAAITERTLAASGSDAWTCSGKGVPVGQCIFWRYSMNAFRIRCAMTTF